MPKYFDLSRFGAFWLAHKWVLGLLVSTATAGPVTDILLGIGPPWPDLHAPRAFLTVIPLFITLAITYRLGQRKASVSALDRRLVRTGLFTVVLLVVYIALLAFLTFTNPATMRYASKGLWMRPELLEDLNRRPPPNADVGEPNLSEKFDGNTDPEDLLESKGYDAERIWVRWTVKAVNFLILLSWLAMFTMLETFIGTFVLLNPA